jgi:hypothetical protein
LRFYNQVVDVFAVRVSLENPARTHQGEYVLGVGVGLENPARMSVRKLFDWKSVQRWYLDLKEKEKKTYRR